MTVAALSFVKGHGTENDFILIPDLDDELDLDADLVRALCDRRAGLGADGVIRIVPADIGGFFMDYRNADGSLAEMCGNGARLFARYLVDAGLERAGSFGIATRGGVREAVVPAVGDVSIAMGPVVLGVSSAAVVRGDRFAGLSVDVGNPHLVCSIATDPAGLDLTAPPDFDVEVFPEGVNIEFVQQIAPLHLRMRVFERGVGETRSCGTGTVAAAAAHLHSAGLQGGTVLVDVPGGRVVVELTTDAETHEGGPPRVAPAFEEATLTGPAVVVATGRFDPGFTRRT